MCPGRDGLIGTWRTAKVVGPTGPQTFVMSSPASGVLHVDVPDMKASAEGRMDGSDNPLIGSDSGTGHDHIVQGALAHKDALRQ